MKVRTYDLCSVMVSKKKKKKEVNIYIDWYERDLNLGLLFDGKKNINRAN